MSDHIDREYISLGILEGYYVIGYSNQNPYDSDNVRRLDQVLHQALCKIFRERGIDSSDVQRLFRAPIRRQRKNSKSMEILLQEPCFHQLFKNEDGLSLLWLAVLCCYQDSSELLVRFGADVNRFSHCIDSNYTLLHVMLRMYPSPWNERFIDLLFEHGLEIRDDQIPILLNLAARHGRVKIAKMLIEKGADVNMADHKGNTPLFEAVRSTDDEMILLLIRRGANVNVADKLGRTPLLVAANNRKADELVPLLIRHGAEINVRDIQSMNALHYLINAPGEHVDLARVLIEKGVSLEERDSYHEYQAIHMAAELGKIQLMNLFLDLGANVNAPTGFNESPLYIARDDETLLALLKRGANIDFKNNRGQTVLHKACELIHRTNVKLFLSIGADMFLEDIRGDTPFNLIENKNTRNRLMVQALALKKACLQSSIEFKDEKILKEKYPEHWNYYQDCMDEINRSKLTGFIESCTLFEIMTKCHCQVAMFMRNREFTRNFWLFDSHNFPIYRDDVTETIRCAEKYYESVLEKENLIDEAVYYALPHMIVRNIASYEVNCEICEIKEIVSKSRGPPEGTNNTE